MATAKDCHAMTTYYMKAWKEKYGTEPVVNRHAARWGFESVLMDMKPSMVRNLIDYYFKTNSPNRHSLDWFLYNYDKLIRSMAAALEDAEHRARLRKESEQRAKEWRERGNQGIAGN